MSCLDFLEPKTESFPQLHYFLECLTFLICIKFLPDRKFETELKQAPAYILFFKWESNSFFIVHQAQIALYRNDILENASHFNAVTNIWGCKSNASCLLLLVTERTIKTQRLWNNGSQIKISMLDHFLMCAWQLEAPTQRGRRSFWQSRILNLLCLKLVPICFCFQSFLKEVLKYQSLRTVTSIGLVVCRSSQYTVLRDQRATTWWGRRRFDCLKMQV